MNIGIFYIGDLRYAPFVNKYIGIFQSAGVDYKVVFWNREENIVCQDDHIIPYKNYMALNISRIKKVTGFWGFRRFCKNIIGKEKFDKLVILTTLSGIILADILKKNYKNRYLFDIRDYTYEHIPFFFDVEKRIIKNAYATIVSSPFFVKFLPPRKYILCHNYDGTGVLGKKERSKVGDVIRIGFVGSLRYFDYQKYLIDALKNDERFVLAFYGSGPEEEKYKNYKKEKHINNMFLYGAFTQEDLPSIVQNIDMLNNCYGYVDDEESPEIKYAVSNKFYTGLQWGIPQLVEAGSCKGDYVTAKKVGMAVDLKDDNLAEKIFEYYEMYDPKELFKNASKLIKKIDDEDNDFYFCIEEFIK